jgi:hypothetical protein
MDPFLQKMEEEKGWKVVREEKDEGREDDEFSAHVDLLSEMQRPSRQLLPDDVLVGVLEFPVISLTAKRVTDTMVHTRLRPHLECDAHVVFGGYLLLTNMALVGIHKSIMRVYDDRDRVVVDNDKFPHLVHYLKSEHPEWEHLLSESYPIQPSRLVGAHFYSPLVPIEVLKTWENGIADWALLNS